MIGPERASKGKAVVTVGNAGDRAYEGVRDLIFSGALAAGAPLRESALAERFGVSRTPIREALRRLHAEGIVDVHPNRGARLISVDHRDVLEIFEVRALLEPYGAQLAAERASDAEIGKLADLARQMDLCVEADPPDLGRLTELNTRFHALILTSSGNRLLASTVGGVVRRPLVHLTFGRYSHEQTSRSQAHHWELISALQARDPSWAESVMRAHVLAARAAFG